MPHGLPRTSRLKRRRLIRALFDREREDVASVAYGCIRVTYRMADREELGVDAPVQAGFSPGRRIRGAVNRNRVKRLLREVYRMHQTILVDLFSHRSKALTLMIIFRGDPEMAADCIPRDLPEVIERLKNRIMAKPSFL